MIFSRSIFKGYKMMKWMYLILGLLLLICGVGLYMKDNKPSPSNKELNEIVTRQYIYNLVQQALDHSDFASLEKMSRSFREDKSRTSSGVWKLSVFYGSFKAENNEAAIVAKENLIDAWANAYPQSPSAHIVKSLMLIRHGFLYRGTKMAKDTPQEAWEPFYKYVKLASDNQLKYKEIASIDPHWYTVTLRLAMLSGWKRPEFDALMKEAVEHEPYYYENYFQAFEYLLPKWQGSFEEADQFAREMQKTTSEKDGRSLYARLYWYLNSSNIDHLFRDDKFASWPEIKAGFDDMMAHYPDEWNLHNYAKIACVAGDKETTQQLIDKIWNQTFVYPAQFGKSPDLTVLQAAWDTNTNDFIGRCRNWAKDPDSTKDNAPSIDTL
jgi:hypothetical protein